MDATGVVTVLYVFPYSIGGGSSQPGPIVQGADGALYGSALGAFGTSAVGGYVYRFDPVTGDFRHLHDFVGSDGAIPTGPLFQAGDGFFYGTTNQGGLWNSGVIYKVDVLGHFVLLHSLSPFFPGEGSEPKGGVIQASDGFFYGTTEQGGYCGEIFRMDAAGQLHRHPPLRLVRERRWEPGERPDRGSRRLPLRDGSDRRPAGHAPSRYGVVYRMDKAGTVTVVHTFTGPDGYQPWAALVQGADGGLYGSTVVGGAFGLGVLFRVDAAAPAPAPLPTLAGLTFSPSSVVGGQSSTGTVTLERPRAVRRCGRHAFERQLVRRLRPRDGDGARRRDERLVRRLDEAGQADEDGDDQGELQRRLGLGHADRHSLIRARAAEERSRSSAAEAEERLAPACRAPQRVREQQRDGRGQQPPRVDAGCTSSAVAPSATATPAATRQSSPTMKFHQKRPNEPTYFMPPLPPRRAGAPAAQRAHERERDERRRRRSRRAARARRPASRRPRPRRPRSSRSSSAAARPRT